MSGDSGTDQKSGFGHDPKSGSGHGQKSGSDRKDKKGFGQLMTKLNRALAADAFYDQQVLK